MTVFKDRFDAGEQLAAQLSHYEGENSLVLGIPNGGVPVGIQTARRLGADFDIILVRKMQLPWNTEAGFGAVAADGAEMLNDEMVASFGLSDEDIRRQKDKAVDNIKQRLKYYGKEAGFTDLKSKTVILTDDGLASGYTMMAGCRYISKYFPRKLVVAVPCASRSSHEKVRSLCDEVISLNVRAGYPFAVASFYENWYDLDEGEVLNMLKEYASGP